MANGGRIIWLSWTHHQRKALLSVLLIVLCGLETSGQHISSDCSHHVRSLSCTRHKADLPQTDSDDRIAVLRKNGPKRLRPKKSNEGGGEVSFLTWTRGSFERNGSKELVASKAFGFTNLMSSSL